MGPPSSIPAFAAWQHCDVRVGFEVAFFTVDEAGLRVHGSTVAVEQGSPFAVRYEIMLDEQWRTRSARVFGHFLAGARAANVEADGSGRWIVNDEAAPHLDGCLDLDLESSSMTNTFPVHRLGLERGQQADAPAAYVRAADLNVDRLEQRYRRLDDAGGERRFDYESPTFDFRCELVYDAAGLVLDYPGIATRVE